MEEINALREVIETLDSFKSLEDILGKKLPEGFGGQKLKPAINSMREKFKYLSSHSRKRKYNTLPVDFVFTLILLAVENNVVAIDLPAIRVLVGLNEKIKIGLNSLSNGKQ